MAQVARMVREGAAHGLPRSAWAAQPRAGIGTAHANKIRVNDEQRLWFAWAVPLPAVRPLRGRQAERLIQERRRNTV
jgi:hypothetical protein